MGIDLFLEAILLKQYHFESSRENNFLPLKHGQ